jgi:hypothetical protein
MTSSFVDVAIGLILMFLVLSLICTTINELIATQLKWRAQSLSQAITQLIDNPQLRDAFYNHGLIANAKVASRGGEPAPGASAAAQNAVPVDAGPAQNASPVKGKETEPGGQPKDREHPSYLDGHTFAMALLDSLSGTNQGKGADSLTTKKFPTVDDIQKIIGDLPDSNIRDVLLANLASGQKDISDIRDRLANWFDTAMDRLSGDYKRSLKNLSLAVGIAIAVVFNADSVSVSRALWKDEALRGSIVNAAGKIVSDRGSAECKETDPGKQSACLVGELKTEQEQLRPFPIGWSHDALTEICKGRGWDGIWLVVMKIFGLLFTGIALSLGAPFWFDLLQKFMNIRGTGAKPQEKTS